jgi:hypothetical protein
MRCLYHHSTLRPTQTRVFGRIGKGQKVHAILVLHFGYQFILVGHQFLETQVGEVLEVLPGNPDYFLVLS